VPVVLTFDLQGASPNQHNRIQSFFERFGWENLGGSSYRYPKLGADQPVEDWLNHVIPALMLFRAFLRSTGTPLTKFTLDCQSSTGFDSTGAYGQPALPSSSITFYPPWNQSFGIGNLRNWIDGIGYPYP
jgi:hypothetical protein